MKYMKKVYFKKLPNKLRVFKSNNSKEYWNFFNRAGKTSSECGIELEVLKEHFQKISNKNMDNEGRPSPTFTDSDNENLNLDFTLDELKAIIKLLKLGKACGIDKIKNEFLKSCPDDVLEVILKFFNTVLNSGIVPEEWCIAVILPLYKNKGSKNDPDNYRGISLLSCVGKLFTALLNKRMTDYLDFIGGIGDEQAGLRWLLNYGSCFYFVYYH